LAGHFLVGVSNPNRNTDVNLDVAKGSARAGVLQVCTPGNQVQPDRDLHWHRWSLGHWVCFALMGVGLPAIASPELLRVARGWPLNKDWYPPVVGPGDNAYIYFPNKITTVKGYWRGQAAVRIKNARELNVQETMRAESQNDSWGNTISAKSSEKSNTKTV